MLLFVVAFVWPRPATPPRLLSDVQGAAGSATTSGVCRELRTRTYRCWVSDSGASGSVRYRVRVAADGSCWSGRMTLSGGDPTPRRIAGCVRGLVALPHFAILGSG